MSFCKTIKEIYRPSISVCCLYGGSNGCGFYRGKYLGPRDIIPTNYGAIGDKKGLSREEAINTFNRILIGMYRDGQFPDHGDELFPYGPP